MNLLITGIHGFVGSNLVKNLSKNNTIYGLDIINPEKDGVVKTFSWDDLDKDLIHNIDVIIHLAGKAHDTKNKSQADVYFKINTDLTKKIYDYALATCYCSLNKIFKMFNQNIVYILLNSFFNKKCCDRIKMI